MKTRRALAIILSAAILSGMLGAFASLALEKIRPPVNDALYALGVLPLIAVLPIAIVYVTWRKTQELRFTGVLVAIAAVLVSVVTAFVVSVASCLVSGKCM